VNRALAVGVVISFIGFVQAGAQIDPEKRQLIQLGYNQPLEGHGPISGYLFYFRNDPGFLQHSNLTLRLAVAPIYIDSELGFSSALGEKTDLAIGLAGGGFADSYWEVRRGKMIDAESFTGHGGEVSVSIYHLFNPNQIIPFNAVLRLSSHYSTYERDAKTAPKFVLPGDRDTVNLRAGLRWGGREPTTFPHLAMEVSGWYEGQLRSESGSYGINSQREVQPASHLFWARGLLIYTFPETMQTFGLNLTAGTSVRVDRFSAYRLGGVLPLVSEFPLTLPGYYFQEISARRFVLLNGQYTLPLDHDKRWNLTASGSVAWVDYLASFEQPGNTHSGLGLGLGYRATSGAWQMVVGYSYGFNALRSHGSGAQSIGVLFQWDLEAKHHRNPYFDINSPYKSRGLFQIFGD
jgi:hypothetical protein